MSQDLLAQDSWRDQMKSHTGGRPDTLIAICDAFLQEVPTLVDRIRQSVEQNDASALRTASHTLKSCLAYVAVDEDVEVAAKIEENSKKPTEITDARLGEIDEVVERWLLCVQTLRDETASAIAPKP